MRRVIMLISVCALLWGCLLTGAHAQQVSIANDNNLLDISLRDADLTTVLTALFNTTGGKYQVRLGNGVNGRIARLQLSQTPFDRALDAILGTDFSYTKQMQGDGVYLYTISGRQSVTGTRMPSVFQAPAIGMPTYGGDTAPLGGGGFAPAAGGGASAGGSGLMSLGGFGTAGATTSGDDAASESSVVKMIRVNYLDVGLLSELLGGKSVDLFELLQSANGDYGSGGGGGGGGYGSSRGSRGSRNNNNNNNDNNYNNNNNNNSSGRSSRSNRNNNNNDNNYNNNNNNNSNRSSRSSRNRNNNNY